MYLFSQSFISAEKWKVKVSCFWLFAIPWNSPESRVGSLSLLQRIFPTQGSNPGLLHCRWILYQLSHKESPRILEWVAYPFSRGSSWPRNRIGVSCIAGRFSTNWAMREAQLWGKPNTRIFMSYFNIIPQYCILFLKLFQLWSLGDLSINFFVSSIHPSLFLFDLSCFSLWAFPYTVPLQKSPGSSHIFAMLLL